MNSNPPVYINWMSGKLKLYLHLCGSVRSLEVNYSQRYPFTAKASLEADILRYGDHKI
jgi:hypothetical protein